MEKREPRRRSTAVDGSALTKSAAWAWLGHRFPAPEFDISRTKFTPKPSRYKLEAMTEIPQTSNSINVCPKSTYSLLDGYEIERISRQLDYYIKSSHDVNDAGGVHGGRRAAVEMKSKDGLKKKVLKGFWLLGPNAVGCGSSSVDEVVDRRQRRPESGNVAAVEVVGGRPRQSIRA